MHMYLIIGIFCFFFLFTVVVTCRIIYKYIYCTYYTRPLQRNSHSIVSLKKCVHFKTSSSKAQQ